MSCRGWSGRGAKFSNQYQGRTGRGQGRGSNRNKTHTTNDNKNKNEKKMKLVQHHMNTKGNYGTFDTILDFIKIKLQH